MDLLKRLAGRSVVSDFVKKVGGFLGIGGAGEQEASGQNDEETPCCEGIVHVAYRGVSDDRLYLAYKRKWMEVKFFQQHGLRVFCAGCRRRLL